MFAVLELIDDPPPPPSIVPGVIAQTTDSLSALVSQVSDLLGGLGVQSDGVDGLVGSLDQAPLAPFPTLSNTLLAAIAFWGG